jgi:hypothetical protein
MGCVRQDSTEGGVVSQHGECHDDGRLSLHRVFEVLLRCEVVGRQEGFQWVRINDQGGTKVGCQGVKEVVV